MENPSLSGKKILIVEDDHSSRFYLNQILEKTGMIIINAADGLAAVDLVSKNPDIDLVLMDIQLPLMDGYEAAPKIKSIKKDVVLIAQTAFGLLDDRDKILASGFDDYLIKPIFKKNLLAKLTAWFERP
jgi:CheY-like chemotaxis protein